MLEEKKISHLYHLHGRELFVYLLHLTGSHEMAEDLLQETFTSLIDYSRRNAVDEKTVRAFLYKTAHNMAVNTLKKESRSIPTEKITATPAPSSVEEDADAAMLHEEIYRILNRLPARDRSIFIMKKENRMSTGEIAAMTGAGERTVRRSLERTLRILADELQKGGFLSPGTIFMTVLFLLPVLLEGEIHLS